MSFTVLPATGIRVLGIAGSLRTESHNRALLRAAGEALPAGAELELWDGLAALPAYDERLDGDAAPAAVRELRTAIGGADALLIATPEYNAGMPGLLKNALDWASRPWQAHALLDKPVAVVGASTGSYGAAWAQADVRRVAAHVGARVVDRELPVGKAPEAFDERGALRDADQAAALAALLEELAWEARGAVADAA